MDVIYYASVLQKKIKFLLVFFCATFFFNCVQESPPVEFTINYKQGKGTSVNFKGEESSEYSVFLRKNDLAPILGTFTSEKGIYTFTPVVAFTFGETYDVNKNDKHIGSFTLDKLSIGAAPELIAIYPSSDTVPQNLLKMYFVFSEPMQHSK